LGAPDGSSEVLGEDPHRIDAANARSGYRDSGAKISCRLRRVVSVALVGARSVGQGLDAVSILIGQAGSSTIDLTPRVMSFAQPCENFDFHRLNITEGKQAMFEQTFRNIDDVLWKEAGCATELDYTEQTSWMLFLKYLDDLEYERLQEAELVGKRYSFIIEPRFRWSAWAAPRTDDGEFDHDSALTGADLIEFVNGELFPYLQGFRERASGPDTIEYKIGEIFSEIRNKFSSGYSLRDALELIDSLSFRSQTEKHELSHLYEAKIRNMGNAGRNGGEYYTPRPLIRAMVRVIDPKIGERIYDAAAGSAGFLCEAHDYLRYGPGRPQTGGKGEKGEPVKLSTSDLDRLQTRTFYAKEKKSLPYVIGIMNMILHGIEAPNIQHTNSLTENLADIQEKDRYDVILANPPFGGKERKEIQQNFPVKTGETAFLFLQHFVKYLKAGGRAAIVIKNTFLSNSDNAATALRRELLEACNLHTILDCPGGTFLGAGVKTVVSSDTHLYALRRHLLLRTRGRDFRVC